MTKVLAPSFVAVLVVLLLTAGDLQGRGEPEVLRVQRIELVDGSGAVRAIFGMGADGSVGLTLHDGRPESSRSEVNLVVLRSGTASACFREGHTTRMFLGKDKEGNVGVVLREPNGVSRLSLSVGSSGDASLGVVAKDSKAELEIGSGDGKPIGIRGRIKDGPPGFFLGRTPSSTVRRELGGSVFSLLFVDDEGRLRYQVPPKEGK